MNDMLLRLLAAFLFLCTINTQLQAQCVPDTTVPNVPNIYPSNLPEATGCQFYEQDVTFVFPRDTSTALGTLPFDNFVIDSIVGLPAGMQWMCNLAPDCKYITHPDSANADTLGCVRLFGTPTIPATYTLEAWATAELIAFGQPAPTPISFQLPLVVSPCQFVGDCYTITLSDNCEPAMLDIVNEVPSNGQAGFSYDWEISGDNGFTFTTVDEQPSAQMLNAGTYVVDYEAIIDTIGYVMNGVIIDSTDCGDLFNGAGDLFWILIDPSGTEIVNTSANPIDGGTDSLPLNTGISGVFLDTGMYEFQVWDDDPTLPLDSPDGCATGANNSGASLFLTIPPVDTGDVVVTVDGLRVIFEIDNPKTLIQCSDTIEVGALPDEPEVFLLGTTSPIGPTLICEGDSLVVETSSSDSLQWFVDDSVIIGASMPILTITEAGTYRVDAIDRDMLCQISSVEFDVQVASVPIPAIAYNGMGELSISSPNPSYTYEWYQPFIGLAGVGETFMPTASGDYTAIAVDPVTGCRSMASNSFNVIVASVDDLMQELTQVALYPNPSAGIFTLELEFMRPQSNLNLKLSDLTGRTILSQSEGRTSGFIQIQLGRPNLATGMYLLQIQTENGLLQRKILIQNQ